jgi:aryl-alcohol dehydrogenase-like predicted oxidoreductase
METSDRRTGLTSRIVLGTAQLGMPYGIANRLGKPSDADAHELIAKCMEHGITWFDTARAYGQSEAVLGRIFADLGIQEHVNVIGKGSLQPDGHGTSISQIHCSLELLGIPRFAFWLAHDEKHLDSYNGDLIAEEEQLRHAGLIGGFGISAYTPQTALKAVHNHGLAAVQFPASPFDRRFFREEFSEHLASAGTALFIRSVFLQGLCLMEPSDVPPGISMAREAVQALSEFCRNHDLPKDRFCLHYVLHRSSVCKAKMVVGLETIDQLERNLCILSHTPTEPGLFDEWDALWPHDHEALILPYLWNTQS